MTTETTPAIERTARHLNTLHRTDDVAARRREAIIAGRALLDVPRMASAIVEHLLTDTLDGDSETLVCGGCGHVLVTGDPDDDRDPQAEHATHHAALIRAHLLGGAA
jgi:hypothetical protein